MSQNQRDIAPATPETLGKDPKHFGRMNDPAGGAFIRGLCGDEMEFYLDIKDDIIEEVRFYTNGCEYTIACGEMTARLASGKSIEEALGISPGEVQKMLKGLPRSHLHCCILAVSTLHKAIADYLLRSEGF